MRRASSNTLPSDRASDRKTAKNDGEGSGRLDVGMSTARTPHLSADQRLEKAAADLIARRKVANAALRQEGVDPDALDRARVTGAAPLPATAAEAAAAERHNIVRQMLGLGRDLDEVLDGFTDKDRETVQAMARLIAGGMPPDAARRVVTGGAR